MSFFKVMARQTNHKMNIASPVRNRYLIGIRMCCNRKLLFCGSISDQVILLIDCPDLFPTATEHCSLTDVVNGKNINYDTFKTIFKRTFVVTREKRGGNG